MKRNSLRYIWTSNDGGAVALRVHTYASAAFIVALALANLHLFI